MTWRWGLDDVAEMPDVAAKMGFELRDRYVLGFSSGGQPRDGRYHRLQLKIVPPRRMPALRAFCRPGYYAPAE